MVLKSFFSAIERKFNVSVYIKLLEVSSELVTVQICINFPTIAYPHSKDLFEYINLVDVLCHALLDLKNMPDELLPDFASYLKRLREIYFNLTPLDPSHRGQGK
ncbi:MAG: hypothetical protein IPM51_11610 [Sphingobacteriaceae bacterium]|nr:hypothetical protein [Sphingobacteriaceae bacterium]